MDQIIVTMIALCVTFFFSCFAVGWLGVKSQEKLQQEKDASQAQFLTSLLLFVNLLRRTLIAAIILTPSIILQDKLGNTGIVAGIIIYLTVEYFWIQYDNAAQGAGEIMDLDSTEIIKRFYYGKISHLIFFLAFWSLSIFAATDGIGKNLYWFMLQYFMFTSLCFLSMVTVMRIITKNKV